MTNEKIVPMGLNPLSTVICVQDANESVRFYVEVFGFKEHEVMNDRHGNVMFARIMYEEINLILMPPSSQEEPSYAAPPQLPSKCGQMIFYLYCKDFDEQYKKAKDYGLTFLHDKESKFWGDKTFRVIDINGYIWDFAARTGEHDATKVIMDVL